MADQHITSARKVVLGNIIMSCPNCCTPYDKGNHRKLIDTCGHGICYMCIKSDHCPMCVYHALQSQALMQHHMSEDAGISTPRLITNGFFSAFTPYALFAPEGSLPVGTLPPKDFRLMNQLFSRFNCSGNPTAGQAGLSDGSNTEESRYSESGDVGASTGASTGSSSTNCEKSSAPAGTTAYGGHTADLYGSNQSQYIHEHAPKYASFEERDRIWRRNFLKALETKHATDITIKVQGKEFPAHRLVLCLFGSPVLRCILEQDIVKESNIVNMDDCDPATFMDFLTHIYSGSCEHITLDNVHSLLTAANNYDMHELKAACVEFIEGSSTNCEKSSAPAGNRAYGGHTADLYGSNQSQYNHGQHPSAFHLKAREGSLASCLLKMLETKNSGDIIIKVQGREFPAHSWMLFGRSPILRSIHQQDMVKGIKVITMDDCDPATFMDFLIHIYTGNCDHITLDNVHSLLTAANNYGIRELKAACVEFIERNKP